MSACNGERSLPFSGLLELLRAIEELSGRSVSPDVEVAGRGGAPTEAGAPPNAEGQAR